MQTGSLGDDSVNAIEVDSLNGVHLAGETDFKILVTKLDGAGAQLWSVTFNSGGEDAALALNIDAFGSIIIAGYATKNLDGSFKPAQDKDYFAMKLDSVGSQQWIYQQGSTSDDAACAVHTDASGDIVLAGYTDGDLFGTLGMRDAFVMKLNAAGSSVSWELQFGSDSDDSADAVQIDLSGYIFVAGFTDGIMGSASLGGADIFVMKLTSEGVPQWTFQSGSTGNDYLAGLRLDSSGFPVVAGTTDGSVDGHMNSGGQDAFAMKLQLAGGASVWLWQGGTTGDDSMHAIGIDASDKIFLVGETFGDIDGFSAVGGWDVLAVKLSSDGLLESGVQRGTDQDDAGKAAGFDRAGNLILAGNTAGAWSGTNAGSLDAFAMKVTWQ